MIIQKKITFCEDQTAPFTSQTFFNPLSDVLTLQIDGSFTNSLIKIEGRSESSKNWVSLAGINLTNFSVAKNGIKSAGLYEFGIIGIREIRVNIEEISGSVTISGQLINAEET